jgi:hypothetical protein
MVAILIAYGSLYPFIFHAAGPVTADLSHFLASWRQPLTSRGDILANLLLYIPLGLAATLAFGHGVAGIWGLLWRSCVARCSRCSSNWRNITTPPGSAHFPISL